MRRSQWCWYQTKAFFGVFRQAVYGKYKWQTFREVYTRLTNLGQGIVESGLKPKEKIALFLDTRAEWIISIQVLLKRN